MSGERGDQRFAHRIFRRRDIAKFRGEQRH
jgi:hypothetical protein